MEICILYCMEQPKNYALLFDEEDFLKTYRGSEPFITQEREYYDLFLELLKDADLLDKIKFANDVLKVAPLETFIKYSRSLDEKAFSKKMTPVAKRGMGACFGYLYKVIYNNNYESQQSWFNDEATGIKTASYFKIK